MLRNMVVYLFVLTWLNHATTATELNNKIVELQALLVYFTPSHGNYDLCLLEYLGRYKV